MRKFIAILALLIAVLVTIPWLVGLHVQYQFQQRVEQAATQANYPAPIISFTRGWFRSQASLDLSPLIAHASQQTTPKFNLLLKVKIQHGPILFSRNLQGKTQPHLAMADLHGQLVADEQTQSLIRPVLGEQALLRVTMRMRLFSEELISHFASFKLDFKNDTLQAHWDGIQGNLKLTDDGNTLISDITIAPMDMTHAASHLQSKAIHITSHANRNSNSIWTGNSELQMPALEWQLDQHGQGSVTQLTFAEKVYAQNQRIGINFLTQVEQLLINSYQIRNSSVDIAMKDISASSLAKVNKLATGLNPHQQTPAQTALYTQNKLKPAIWELMSKGFDIGVKSHVETLSGNVDITGTMTLAADDQAPLMTIDDMRQQVQASLLIKAPFEISRNLLTHYYLYSMQQLASTQAKTNSTPPSARDMQLEAQEKMLTQLNQWLTQGYLRLDEGRYVLDMSYINKQLTIGDRTIPHGA